MFASHQSWYCLVKLRLNSSVAAYALFGMMNWMHTWYDPAGRLRPDELAAALGDLFLHGFAGPAPAV